MFYKKIINLLVGWLPLIKTPKWLIKKTENYIYYYEKKYGTLPYNVVKHFNGKTFVYKVFYKTIAQGQLKTQYYKKYRIIKK